MRNDTQKVAVDDYLDGCIIYSNGNDLLANYYATNCKNGDSNANGNDRYNYRDYNNENTIPIITTTRNHKYGLGHVVYVLSCSLYHDSMVICIFQCIPNFVLQFRFTSRNLFTQTSCCCMFDFTARSKRHHLVCVVGQSCNYNYYPVSNKISRKNPAILKSSWADMPDEQMPVVLSEDTSKPVQVTNRPLAISWKYFSVVW